MLCIACWDLVWSKLYNFVKSMFYQTATHLHQKYSFKNRQEQNSCRQFVKILILFLINMKNTIVANLKMSATAAV